MSKVRAVYGHLFGSSGASTIGAAAVLLAGFSAMVGVRADQPVRLAIEKGLWEVTVHPQMSGADPMRMAEMDKEMQKLTPEQRERMKAAMQAMMTDVNREHVFRECMTEERLSKGFTTGRDSPDCTSKVVSNTSTEFEYHKECSSESGGGHSEKAHFKIHSRHNISGTVDAVESRGGEATTVHETIEGKWVASDCGGVKDVQRVR